MSNGTSSTPVQSIPLSPTFKLVFYAALGLTLLSLLIALGISFVETPNAAQKEIFNTCAVTWKIGVGAIIGLIGGKAT